MLLIELFISFFKMGAVSFGGGYTMVSILRQVAVDNAWMTAEQFADILAISQITPGPFAVNMATFVGFRQAGVAGSIVATIGVTMPSFILIMLAFKFINMFKASKVLDNIFFGLRPAVVGLITAAVVQLAMPEILPVMPSFNLPDIVGAIEFRAVAIFIAAFVGVYKFKANIILVVVLAAVLGILLF